MDKLDIKYDKLKNYLKNLGSAVIAFSGGIDSTFLLKTAYDVLGKNILAVTVSSCSFPKRELDECINFCKKENIQYSVVEMNELKINGFSDNPKNRCYLCKKELFQKISDIAKENNISNIIEGSNTDDKGDYRPGMQAISEAKIKSPLIYADLNKNEIRILSKKMGISSWNKPSFACLASRFVYGEKITEKKLNMIDKSEQFLFDLGFTQVRVRIHGNEDFIARIEVKEDELNKIIDNRKKIYSFFKEIGFNYTTLDIQGYRTGSMNEIL